MPDFLDFDALELDTGEQIDAEKVHPLQGMNSGVKTAYVGGLLFACYADDNAFQREERSIVTGVACSLGLSKDDVEELVEETIGIKDKIGYLREMVAMLHDRKTILFFLCDMMRAMGADGELNVNARKLVACLEKMAHLGEEDVRAVAICQQILTGDSTIEADGPQNEGGTDDEVYRALTAWCTSARNLFPVASKIRLAFKGLANGQWPRFYLNPVPEKQRNNAHDSMQIREQEHIVQIDTTAWGSGKEGLVLTDRALYYKTLFESPHRITWKNMRECTCKKDDNVIWFGEFGSLCCTGSEAKLVENFCQRLGALIKELQKNPSAIDAD